MQQEADVLIRLEQEIRARADKIVRDAESKAKGILTEADRESVRLLGEARAKTSARLAQLRARRTAQAALESRQRISRVKADAVHEAIRTAGAQLTSDQMKPSYKKALGTFLTEALESLKLSKGPLRIVTRREDEAEVKELAAAKGLKVSVSTDAQFSGGIEIIDESAHHRVVNTFESRLRQGFETVSDRVRKVLNV